MTGDDTVLKWVANFKYKKNPHMYRTAVSGFSPVTVSAAGTVSTFAGHLAIHVPIPAAVHGCIYNGITLKPHCCVSCASTYSLKIDVISSPGCIWKIKLVPERVIPAHCVIFL